MPSQPFVTKKPNSISGTSCLRDLVLTVPPAISLGETVTLNCTYHLQGENLYAIKLYKGRNEFMTYAAERQPPLRSFPLKGIHIGVRKSQFSPIYNCLGYTNEDYHVSSFSEWGQAFARAQVQLKILSNHE